MNDPRERAAAPPAEPNPVWPLFLLAGLAFVPGFGFLFGAVAASWGLLSDRPRALWAAALAGVGVLLQVAGVAFLLLWLQGKSSLFSEAVAMATQQDLAELVEALEAHHDQRDAYPASLDQLQHGSLGGRFVNIYDQGGGVFRVPRPYQYRLAPGGEAYDLFSAGPDRKPGTADDIRPALADSVRSLTGYRPPQ